jgi:hypothetical protein
MTCIGKVSEGKVILPPGVHLPAGAEVELHIDEKNAPVASASGDFTESLLGIAAKIQGLPPDLARNHDHYLHGHPPQ